MSSTERGHLSKDQVEQIGITYFHKKKPLFTREIFENISRLLKEYNEARESGKTVDPPKIMLQRYVDGHDEYELELDLGIQGKFITHLNYLTIQHVLNPWMYWRGPEWQHPGSKDDPNLGVIQKTRQLVPEIEYLKDGLVDQSFFMGKYEEYLRLWNDTDTRKSVKNVFSGIDPWTLKKINKIIAFGCGTLCQGLQPPPELSICTQHAIIKDIRQFICDATGSNKDNIVCYVQDPGYCPWDEALLKSLEFEILRDPDGFTKVDESTLVVAIRTDCSLLQILADLDVTPEMIFHDEVAMDEEWEEYKNTRTISNVQGKTQIVPLKGVGKDSGSPRVRDMLQGYRAIVVEDPDHRLTKPKTLRGTVISENFPVLYVRE